MSAAISGDLATLFANAPSASFPTPWSARAFALAMAASEAGLFDLAEFQQGLIESIHGYEANGLCIDGEEAYYSCWVETLVKLLGQKGGVELQRIAAAEHQIRQRVPANVHTHSHDDDHLHGPTTPSPVCVEAGQ
jgi:nitrile hydratase accessory protein